MGNRIPKKAQRLIDKANRATQDRRINTEIKQAIIPVPRVMAMGMTPRHIMNLFDVYLNGEKQTLCTLANVDKGLVRRWDKGIGHTPLKGAVQEEVFGKVEIRRRPL